MGLCSMAQETQIGALYQPRRVGGEGDGREVQKGGDMCTPMADSCWGLTENKKIKKKKKTRKQPIEQLCLAYFPPMIPFQWQWRQTEKKICGNAKNKPSREWEKSQSW